MTATLEQPPMAGRVRHTATRSAPATTGTAVTGAAYARRLRPVVLVVAVGLACVRLRGHLPGAGATWAALRDARVGWLALAALLQLVSMAAFAEQERRLLAAFGVRISAAVALATTFARSAMATALPAGSAVAAAYGYRQFRRRGADQAAAAAVMVLCGVASVTGLAVLYAGDCLIWAGSPAAAAVLGAVLVGVIVLLRLLYRRFYRRYQHYRPGAVPPVNRVGRAWRALLAILPMAATVPVRRWLVLFGLAVLNWSTDLGCLLAALHAVGLGPSTRTVATAYLAAQLIRLIPLTPGGIGVIDASLVVAFTTGATPLAVAAAGVLIYRVLSCWLLIPIGLACWTALRPPAVVDERDGGVPIGQSTDRHAATG